MNYAFLSVHILCLFPVCEILCLFPVCETLINVGRRTLFGRVLVFFCANFIFFFFRICLYLFAQILSLYQQLTVYSNFYLYFDLSICFFFVCANFIFIWELAGFCFCQL